MLELNITITDSLIYPFRMSLRILQALCDTYCWTQKNIFIHLVTFLVVEIRNWQWMHKYALNRYLGSKKTRMSLFYVAYISRFKNCSQKV